MLKKKILLLVCIIILSSLTFAESVLAVDVQCSYYDKTAGGKTSYYPAAKPNISSVTGGGSQPFSFTKSGLESGKFTPGLSEMTLKIKDLCKTHTYEGDGGTSMVYDNLESTKYTVEYIGGEKVLAKFDSYLNHEEDGNNNTLNLPSLLPLGVGTTFDNKTYESIIDVISQRQPLKIRITDQGGARDEIAIPYTGGACIKMGGDGPIGIVFMRGKSASAQIGDFYGDFGLKQAMLETDPFKKYIDKFSFYVDLVNQNDSEWLARIASDKSDVRLNGFEAIKHISSCGGETIYAMATGVGNDLGAQSGIGTGVFVFNTKKLYTSGVDMLHAIGHAFASLSDEYSSAVSASSITPAVASNCTTDPETDFLYNGKLYGKKYKGCSVVKNESGGDSGTDTVFKSTYSSRMNVEPAGKSSKFNTVECASIVKAILRSKGSPKEYYPMCAELDVEDKVEDSEFFPYDATPLTIINATPVIIGPLKLMIVEAGDGVVIHSSTPVAVTNSVQLVNVADASKKYRIDNLIPQLFGSTGLTATIPLRVSLGDYELRVSTPMSTWSNPVPIRIIRPAAPQLVPSQVVYEQTYSETCSPGLKCLPPSEGNNFTYQLTWNDTSGGRIIQKSKEYSEKKLPDSSLEDCALVLQIDIDFNIKSGEKQCESGNTPFDFIGNIPDPRLEGLVVTMMGRGRSGSTVIQPVTNLSLNRAVVVDSKMKLFVNLDPEIEYQIRVKVVASELNGYPGRQATYGLIAPKDITVGNYKPDKNGVVTLRAHGQDVIDMTVSVKNAKLFTYAFSDLLFDEVENPQPQISSAPVSVGLVGNIQARLDNFTKYGIFAPLQDKLQPVDKMSLVPQDVPPPSDGTEPDSTKRQTRQSKSLLDRALGVAQDFTNSFIDTFLLRKPAEVVVPSPTPSPSPSVSTSPISSPRISPSISPKPKVTPSPIPSPTARPVISPTPYLTPLVTPSASPTPYITPTPTPSPYFSPTPTPYVPPPQLPSSTPSPAPSLTPSPSPTPFPVPSSIPSSSPSPSPTPTPIVSSSPYVSSSPWVSPSPLSQKGTHRTSLLASMVYTFADLLDSIFSK